METGLVKIKNIIVHRVGNKSRDEGAHLSKRQLNISAEVSSIIINDFVRGVGKAGAESEFFHESRMDLNEVFQYSKDIFRDDSKFLSVSQSLAKHLYSKSTHPNIAGGDFVVALFEGLLFGGKEQKVIGLFKLEIEEQYLSISESNGIFEIKDSRGVDPRKIQKAALILEDAKTVLAVESGHSVTRYWNGEFLKIKKSVTPHAINNVAGKIIKRTLNEIDGVDKKIEYTEGVSGLLKADAVKLSDFSEFNESFIGKDKAKSIFKGVLDDSDDLIKSDAKVELDVKILKRDLRQCSRRLSVADGIDIIAVADTEIISVERLKSSDENEIIIKIRKRSRK